MSGSPSPGKLIVWYNTKCPVCDAGIGWQSNRLVKAARNGLIEFRDINLEPTALASRGSDIEAVRRRLHGLDDKGVLYVGADCAIEIWRRTPGDAWLAAVLGSRWTRWATRLSYDGFAAILYAWNRRRGNW